MCGIIGVANFGNSNIKALQDYMTQGAIVGVLRGDDGTGVFQHHKRSDVIDIVKAPYSGEMFATSKGFKRLNSKMDEPGFSVLHHRAATRGTVSHDNAHPFTHKEGDRYIVGVHNGTLHSASYSRNGKSFDVDSDYLMYSMMVEGSEKALSTIRGSIASVWTEGDGNLKLFRNSDRPLSFAIIKGENAILIASEAAMLYWLASRNKIALEDIIIPDVNTIHIFSSDKNVRDFTTTAVEVPSYTNFHQTPTTRRHVTHTATGQVASTPVRDTTSTTEKILDELKFTKGQEVTFWPMPDTYMENTETRFGKINGWIDNGKDFVQAVIYNITPNIAAALEKATEATCSILGAHNIKMSDGTEDVVVVLSRPSMVLKSSDEDAEDDEATPEETVPGPRRRPIPLSEFFKKTTNGCISCADIITPADAKAGKLTWVNEDRDVLCSNCSEDFHKANG